MGLEVKQAAEHLPLGIVRIGSNLWIKSTNGFIFCAQFCNYNREVVMAVGGSACKFYSLEEKNVIVELEFDKENLLYSCDSGYTGTRFLTGGKNGSLFYFGNNKTLE